MLECIVPGVLTSQEHLFQLSLPTLCSIQRATISDGHMFYGVDLDRPQAVYGSRDEGLLAEVLQA